MHLQPQLHLLLIHLRSVRSSAPIAEAQQAPAISAQTADQDLSDIEGIMIDSMYIVKAEADQIERIVDMSIRAFETDVNVGGTKGDCPPGFDSIE